MTGTDDKNNGKTNSQEVDIILTNYNSSGLQLSSIELGEEILEDNRREEEYSGFFKNNRWVYPRPNKKFTAFANVLGIYFEVYNMHTPNERIFNSLITQYQIKNNLGKIVLEKAFRLTKPNSETAAISINCPLSKLSNGKYKMIVSVMDEDSKNQIQKEVEFCLDIGVHLRNKFKKILAITY